MIVGEYGCPKRFWYDRSTPRDYTADVTSGRAALGTATHEVIAEFLHSGTIASLLEHDTSERLHHHLRAQGPIDWYGDSPTELIAERVAMIVGLFRRLAERVHRVIATEAGFIVRVGEYWVSGHVDVLYEPVHHPGGIALADWKTSSQKPHQIELDHGWEAGLYSAAVRDGLFVPRGGHTRESLEATLIDLAQRPHDPTYGTWPCEVHQVHLADFVPYTRAGTKAVKRPEDLAHYGLTEPGQVRYSAGQQRGGGWLRVRLGESDLPRLSSRLRTLVGMVRLGRFFDRPGEPCTRCPHSGPCLNDGYVTPNDPQLIALTKIKPRTSHI